MTPDQALKRLRPTARQVIIWRNKNGLTFEEIAERLMIKVGQAKRIWAEAIRALKKEIEHEPIQKETCQSEDQDRTFFIEDGQ